jgi:hypothetical protein
LLIPKQHFVPHRGRERLGVMLATISRILESEGQ